MTIEISTRPFTYLAAKKELVAEASSLPTIPTDFTLVSHRTGTHIPVALFHVERDREGDVLWWTYRPIAACGHRAINLVRIFND